MSLRPAVLQGGPRDGRVIHLDADCKVFVVPHLPPSALAALTDPVVLPPYRWWHRLLRRPVPLPPQPPQYRELRYLATDEVSGGRVVYRLEGGRP